MGNQIQPGSGSFDHAYKQLLRRIQPVLALEHPQRMAEMAAAGRVQTLEKFSLEANLARFLKLIQAE